MWHILISAALLFLLTGEAGAAHDHGKNKEADATHVWRTLNNPTDRPPQVYGFHTAGCLDGGEQLPLVGPGYVVREGSPQHAYGHPDLIRYIQGLAQKVDHVAPGTMLIGDLAQPRGGPLPGGHSSHQTGLDVDIWFERLPAEQGELETPASVRFISSTKVNQESKASDRQAWRISHALVLQMAAQSEVVDKIFVNPVIKADLCRQVGNQPWLAKIRPWWGHNLHFHVRLKCPADSPQCQNTGLPAPAAPGCDETLTAWLAKEEIKHQVVIEKTVAQARWFPPLPPQCRAVRLEQIQEAGLIDEENHSDVTFNTRAPQAVKKVAKVSHRQIKKQRHSHHRHGKGGHHGKGKKREGGRR